jgi:hypothetical protein
MAIAPDAPFLLTYDVKKHQRADFEKFVTDGKKNPDGTFARDDQGAEMTGVIPWLRANGLTDTKIYTVEKPGGDFLFIATAARTIPAGVNPPDWSKIAGFKTLFGDNIKALIRDDLDALITAP